jgi:hypothetical protein
MPGMIGSAYGAPDNWSDRLSIIGAALKDASPGSNGNLEAARNFIMQRRMAQAQMGMMSQLGGLFGSQAPQFQDGPAPSVAAPTVAATVSPAGQGASPAGLDDLSGAMGQAATSAAPGPAPQAAAPYTYQPPTQLPGAAAPSLSDPTTQQTLLRAAMFGVPGAKEAIDILDKSRPTVKIGPDGTAYDERSPAALMRRFANRSAVNGQIVDLNDPGNTNRMIPTSPTPGASPVYDNRGNVVDWQLPGGAAQAIAQSEGAKTGAQEQAKAGWNLVDVPLSDGRTVKLPLAMAAPMLAARAAGVGVAAPTIGSPQGDIGGQGGPIAPQFGVTQTPAEAELAKGRAATQGKNETDVAGAKSAMQQVDDQTNMIAQNLHDMLGETQDPNTGKWVKTKPSMVTGLSTGSATDAIEHIPFLNQQAKDLEAKIETVRNGTSFNSLQAIKNALAAAGDGGSGSIRMTDQTARMLGEINGSLNQDQSGPQFEATVRRHLAQLDALNKARHDLFESQYQGIRPNTPGQTGPTANYNKPSTAAQSSPRVPQPGAVVKGYRFLGGNPASPQSWAKVQ